MMRSIMVPGFEPLGAMIVAPDALHGEPWHTAVNQRAVVTLAERVLAAHPELDARRVLLTGYSMGGRGTWRIGPRNPGLFTALMPMAAPVEWPDEAEPARPICVLHSTEDELFDGADVRAGVAALAARGADVELRMIDGVGHFELPRFAAVVRDALPWLAGAWG